MLDIDYRLDFKNVINYFEISESDSILIKKSLRIYSDDTSRLLRSVWGDNLIKKQANWDQAGSILKKRISILLRKSLDFNHPRIEVRVSRLVEFILKYLAFQQAKYPELIFNQQLVQDECFASITINEVLQRFFWGSGIGGNFLSFSEIDLQWMIKRNCRLMAQKITSVIQIINTDSQQNNEKKYTITLKSLKLQAEFLGYLQSDEWLKVRSQEYLIFFSQTMLKYRENFNRLFMLKELNFKSTLY